MVINHCKQWIRLGALSVVLAAMTTWCGCGGRTEDVPAPDTNTTAAKQSSEQTTNNQVAVTRFSHPKETVTEFLQSLKAGDQKRATSMLTVKAQTEMARTEAMIAPQGSQSATYEVTDFLFLGENEEGAHVMSSWTDVESNGESSSHEIVWILRKDQGGWAIAGFATSVFEDQDPLLLNFEDPMDLQQKRASVDAEIARREAPATPQQAQLEDRETMRR